MFFAIIDEAGMYLASGFNSTSKEDLKSQVLELVQSDTEQDDFEAFEKMDIKEICNIKGWGIDESETKFPDAFEIDEDESY